MPLYLVKVRQELEWEGPVEAPVEEVAIEVARMEARQHGTMIDEQYIVEEVTDSRLEVVD